MVIGRSNSRPGFTLIELMVVLVVSAIFMTALGTMLKDARGGVAHINAVDNWRGQARAAFNRIAHDLHQTAHPPSWDGRTLEISDPQSPGESVVYRLDGAGSDDGRLTRQRYRGAEAIGQPLLMASDVTAFEVDIDGRRFRGRLVFFAWYGTYRASAEHETMVALPSAAERAHDEY